MSKHYYNTIEPKPLPSHVDAPPEGWVYVGTEEDVPTLFPERPYGAHDLSGDWHTTWVGDGINKHYFLPEDSPYLKRKEGEEVDHLKIVVTADTLSILLALFRAYAPSVRDRGDHGNTPERYFGGDHGNTPEGYGDCDFPLTVGLHCRDHHALSLGAEVLLDKWCGGGPGGVSFEDALPKLPAFLQRMESVVCGSPEEEPELAEPERAPFDRIADFGIHSSVWLLAEDGAQALVTSFKEHPDGLILGVLDEFLRVEDLLGTTRWSNSRLTPYEHAYPLTKLATPST